MSLEKITFPSLIALHFNAQGALETARYQERVVIMDGDTPISSTEGSIQALEPDNPTIKAALDGSLVAALVKIGELERAAAEADATIKGLQDEKAALLQALNR